MGKAYKTKRKGKLTQPLQICCHTQSNPFPQPSQFGTELEQHKQRAILVPNKIESALSQHTQGDAVYPRESNAQLAAKETMAV